MPSPALHVRRLLPPALFLLALTCILGLAWWAYHPGLSGDFLFDDYANLPAIGATGPIDNAAAFWRYLTSGTADPTGRPVAMLSFLLDARNWPAPPRPFKVTNVLLHLANGALLAWLLLELGRALDGRRSRRAACAALVGAGLWLLHPLLVSTTLYIVQRETMLAATFVLAGLLIWTRARAALAAGHVRRGLTGLCVAGWLCTLLATLSKANGALLPLLLLVLEGTVLARQALPAPRLAALHVRARVLFALLPACIVVAGLLAMLPGAWHSAPLIRGWTIPQRLLSEARALVDYLHLLIVPSAHSSGLFNDQFHPSRGWLHPTATLPCVLAVAVLLGLGFAIRRRLPVLAAALLFYFAAMLMESGWLSLELYFEHRNYLPALLLFWPLGWWLAAPGMLRAWRLAGAVALGLFLATLTWQRASLWGEGYNLAQTWAAFDEASPRAQTNAALYDLARHQPRLAAARLAATQRLHPTDVQSSLNLITAECQQGAVTPASLAAARHALSAARVGGALAYNWLEATLPGAAQPSCTGLSLPALQGLLAAADANPLWARQKDWLTTSAHLHGQLDLHLGRPLAALAAFNRALAIVPDPSSALEQAALLGTAGCPRLGVQHLDYAATLPAAHPGPGMPRLHAWVLARQDWWPDETRRLRAALQAAPPGHCRSHGG